MREWPDVYFTAPTQNVWPRDYSPLLLSQHHSAPILFCDITKSSENVISENDDMVANNDYLMRSGLNFARLASFT